MWNLKYGTNELIYETDSQRQQTCGCQAGWDVDREWMGSLGVADSKYIYRMHKEQVLLCSTGDNI